MHAFGQDFIVTIVFLVVVLIISIRSRNHERRKLVLGLLDRNSMFTHPMHHLGFRHIERLLEDRLLGGIELERVLRWLVNKKFIEEIQEDSYIHYHITPAGEIEYERNYQ